MTNPSKKDIELLHQRIDYLAKENYEFRMLIHALINSHPDRIALAQAIERSFELFLAKTLYSDLPDETLNYLRRKKDRALRVLLPRDDAD